MYEVAWKGGEKVIQEIGCAVAAMIGGMLGGAAFLVIGMFIMDALNEWRSR